MRLKVKYSLGGVRIKRNDALNHLAGSWHRAGASKLGLFHTPGSRGNGTWVGTSTAFWGQVKLTAFSLKGKCISFKKLYIGQMHSFWANMPNMKWDSEVERHAVICRTSRPGEYPLEETRIPSNGWVGGWILYFLFYCLVPYCFGSGLHFLHFLCIKHMYFCDNSGLCGKSVNNYVGMYDCMESVPSISVRGPLQSTGLCTPVLRVLCFHFAWFWV